LGQNLDVWRFLDPLSGGGEFQGRAEGYQLPQDRPILDWLLALLAFFPDQIPFCRSLAPVEPDPFFHEVVRLKIAPMTLQGLGCILRNQIPGRHYRRLAVL
jgi:hypothetical protein